ncbi:MAG TPA: hypothetical protein DCW78_12335, partial [Pseudomonas sp.]|nr:hypothetical protein [Pseudomonas sp.]
RARRRAPWIKFGLGWWMVAYAALSGAALSSAGTAGCASHGASLFLVWPRKSNQKEGHPCIRVLLR